jgi:hypothetical protein
MQAAIADNPLSTATLRYAIECNRVLDGWGLRLHRDVLENVPHDIASSSAYEGVEGWQTITDQSALEADIYSKLTNIVGRIREHSDAAIVFGEYGWPANAGYFPSAIDVGGLVDAVWQAGDDLGVEGEIFWALCGNEEISPGVSLGFDVYQRNGNSATVGALTEAGVFFDANLP